MADRPAPDASRERSARRWLAALEPARASAEFLALGASLGPLMLAPRGAPHSVLVLPGLGASDTSTLPLRNYLSWLGYRVLPWELGRNRGITTMWQPLTERVHAVLDGLSPEHAAAGLSLLGWSLGGTLALGIAFVQPARIRQVITLGSPQLPASGVAAPWLRAGYRLMNLHRLTLNDVIDDWPWPRQPPPHTAIYSKSDAVVPWRIARGGETATQRIEVFSSHLGLGVNPAVFYAIAERLASDGKAPFKPPHGLAALYPTPTSP